MDNRKNYVAPAIAWEDVLEQTSLACQATQPWPGAPTQIYAAVYQCPNTVEKYGAFTATDGACDINVRPGSEVVLS